MYNVYDIEPGMEDKHCQKCGIDLTALAIPEPLLCNLCGEMCYNPCRKATAETSDGPQACMMRVAEPLITKTG